MIPQLYRYFRLHLPATRAYAAYLTLRRRVLVTEQDWRRALFLFKFRPEAEVAACIRGLR